MKNNKDIEISFKDRFFSLFEVFVQCIKYQGLAKSIKIIFHYIYCRFFAKFITSGSYKFLKYKIYFFDIKHIAHMFFELFGLNVYYFKSKSDNPVIIDIGANIGDSIIYFKWLYPDCKIYAFEPLSRAYELLEKNIKENNFKDVFTHNVGLGSKEEKIKIFSDSKGTSGSSTINKKTSQLNLTNNAQYEEIVIKRISSYKEIAKLKEIDLIKLDIEGAEGFLFDDLKFLLPKTKKIILEFHVVPDIAENSFDKIVTILRSSGLSTSFAGFYRNSKNESNSFAFLIIGTR